MANLKKETIFAAMTEIATRNDIPTTEISAILEAAVVKSFHSKFDPDAELEFIIDFDAKVFTLINKSKMVVADEVDFPNELRTIEIPLKLAHKIAPKAKLGDFVREEVNFDSYSRMVAQQVKQLFIQKIRDKRKEVIYAKHKSLVGEMIDVTVETIAPNHGLFKMEDGTDAFMPQKFMALNTKYKIGQKVQVYVEEVLEEAKGSQVIVSNASKTLVKRALENEIPEIMDGTIEVMSMARIPGLRTKIAVRSLDPNVDPVGAIIGASGERIKRIIERLNGEKLDIIRYSSDINEYVANAISPARAIAVFDKAGTDGDKKIVLVPSKHKTLAIGIKGYNARLTAELVGLGIDVVSQEEAAETGLTYEWNGNITAEEIVKLDEGQNINKWGGRQSRQRQYQTTASFNLDEFNDDIQHFQAEINAEPTRERSQTVVNKTTPIDVKSQLDAIFTDDELQKMESEFEVDNELAEFADIDLDSFKMEDND